jgi:hypothetical protein
LFRKWGVWVGMMARLGGWDRQRPPDGKYLPDEPASFAKSMNSSVKRNLFHLPTLVS